MPHGLETNSEPLRRYLATSSTSSAFAITDGTITATIPANMILMQGRRGIDCAQFFGTGAANSTFDYKIYAIERISPTNQAGTTVTSQTALYEYRNLGGGTVTLGTKVGVAGGVIDTTDRVADGLTWTASSYGTFVLEAFGGADADAVAFSPADNTIASLTALDIGDCYGIVFDFDMTGATSGNVLIRLGT